MIRHPCRSQPFRSLGPRSAGSPSHTSSTPRRSRAKSKRPDIRRVGHHRPLVTLTLGAIEFGYTFRALHTGTQATAAGARAASVLQGGNRDACGRITDTSAIDSLVRSQVGRVVTV